jgi:hypothetical protein
MSGNLLYRYVKFGLQVKKTVKSEAEVKVKYDLLSTKL